MKRELLSKIGSALMTIFFAAFIVYSCVVAWWLFYPYNPITVERPIKIINSEKTVKQGGVLVYKVKYKKHMNITGTLSRKLINSFKLDLRDAVANAAVGPDCDQVKVDIPKNADPGKYYLWWSVSYKVNPLRIVTVSVESEPFEVIAIDIPKGPKGDQGIQGRPGPAGKNFWGK